MDSALAQTAAGAALPPRAMSASSALLWAAHLLMAPGCPLVVRAGAAGAVGAAYSLATPAVLQGRWSEALAFTGLLEAIAITKLVRKRPLSLLNVGITWAARLALQRVVLARGGALGEHRAAANAVAAATVLLLAAQRDPVNSKPSVFHLGLLGWIYAALTEQPATYLYSLGFLASVMQGTAHAATGQPATLVQLQGDGAGKFAHEWSHTTYFPSLLLHSVYQSVFGQ